MTIEDRLRDTVAPRGASDPAVEERVRREAMTALTKMRRRHRVRRVVSLGAAAAGIAAIAGFFAFAMPRGGDDASQRGPAPAGAPLPVSLLDRPERTVDRLPGEPARYGAGASLGTVRFAVAGDRLRFYVARPADRDRICVIATTKPGGRPRGAACNGPEALRRVGVLAFIRQGVSGDVDMAFLVPDGIDRVVVGDRSLPVTDNMAAVTGTGTPPRTVTLVGDSADGVRPDGGPDWPRARTDGRATVTVPLSHASSLSDAPTPVSELRLVAPASAPAGTVIPLRIAGPSGLVDRDVIYGVEATLDRRIDGRWVPAYHLTFPGEEGRPFPAVPFGTPNFAWTSVGLLGSAPGEVWLPSVAPGTYRIRKDVNRAGPDGSESRELSTEIGITPDPVPLPETANPLVDPAGMEVVAIGPDGTRVWRGAARPEAVPPGGGKALTCWVFSGPGRAGTDCSAERDLIDRGGFAVPIANPDGTWWSMVVTAPGAGSIVSIERRQVLAVNGIAFTDRLRTARPTVRVTFPDGVKTFR